MKIDNRHTGAAHWTRRSFLQAASAAGALGVPHAQAAPAPFAPTWASLVENYRTPDWFRDAKFGIWAHWSAQCVPEQGDWYARSMYLQGHPQYEHHLKTYGHPTQVGFMEMNNRWQAENWDPDALLDLYAKAGARYFVVANDVAMAVTPLASILLARPSTAFCSCSSVGMPRRLAAFSGGKVG